MADYEVTLSEWDSDKLNDIIKLLEEIKDLLKGKTANSTVHTMPINDIKEHEESLLCWCNPRIDRTQPNHIIHNAFAESYGDERNLE
jgi:hypothetical protein